MRVPSRFSARGVRAETRWLVALAIPMVMTAFLPNMVIAAAEVAARKPQTARQTPAAPTQTQKARPTPPAPTSRLILGELTNLAVRDLNDRASGGRIVVDGKSITIPDRTLVGLPSGQVPLRDLVLGASAECKSQQPPQSGLAVSDSCRGDRPPALARVLATPGASGELIASLVMIQQDSARTLARIKPQRNSRGGPDRRPPAGAAAYPQTPGTPSK